MKRKQFKWDLNHIAVSFITLSELYYGAYKSQKVKQNLSAIKSLESKREKVGSDIEVCEAFGKLKSQLEKDGKIIDDADLFIACCALKTDRVLVTNNERHFSRIHGLKLENWTKK